MIEKYVFTIPNHRENYVYTATLKGDEYVVEFTDEEGEPQEVTYPESTFIANLKTWKAIIQEEVKTISVQELVERVKEDIETINVSYKTVVKYGGLTYESDRQNSDELLDLVNTLKVTTDALKKYVKY